MSETQSSLLLKKQLAGKLNNLLEKKENLEKFC